MNIYMSLVRRMRIVSTSARMISRHANKQKNTIWFMTKRWRDLESIDEHAIGVSNSAMELNHYFNKLTTHLRELEVSTRGIYDHEFIELLTSIKKAVHNK